MRWLVTLDIPNERASPPADHNHVDVGNPEEAAHVIRAISDGIGRPVNSSVIRYEGEWHCARCQAWRLEIGGALLVTVRGGEVPVRPDDLPAE